MIGYFTKGRWPTPEEVIAFLEVYFINIILKKKKIIQFSNFQPLKKKYKCSKNEK